MDDAMGEDARPGDGARAGSRRGGGGRAMPGDFPSSPPPLRGHSIDPDGSMEPSSPLRPPAAPRRAPPSPARGEGLAPPPHFVRSSSPSKLGEDLSDFQAGCNRKVQLTKRGWNR